MRRKDHPLLGLGSALPDCPQIRRQTHARGYALSIQTIQQRAVPTQFQGRVGSVYRIGVFGGLVIGQVVGGVVAQEWGLAAPFWFAFIGSGITLALVWTRLARIAQAQEP